MKKASPSNTLFFILLLMTVLSGCVKKHLVPWADITLRNYRDMPGLIITADEWQRCEKLYHEAPEVKSKELRESRKLFCRGKAMAAAGQKEQAMAILEQASSTDPGWALPYEAMGRLFLEHGDLEAAKDMFEKASTLDPQWTSALSDLGVVYFNLGKPINALQCFDQAVNIDPSQAHLHSNRGNVLTSLGRYDEALDAHLDAINLEPQNPILYINFTATLEEINDPENLLWAMKRLKDLLPQSKKPVCSLKIAVILDEMGRSDEALSELKGAAALDPGNKKISAALKKFYFAHKLYAHLIDFIVELSKKGCKKCSQECFDAGNMILREGNLDGAQKAYEEAIKLKDDWADPYHNLGIVHYRKNNHKKALELFQQARTLQPDDPSTCLNIAMAYYRMGKAQDALSWAAIAFEMHADRAIVNSNIGEILRFQGETKEARKAHEQAVSSDPDNCFIVAQYAMLLIDMNKKNDAQELLKNSLDKDCAAFHLAHAWLLLKNKDYDKALEEAEAAIEKDGSMAEALAVRASILFKQKKKKEAGKDLEAAVCMETRIGGDKRYMGLVKKLKISVACE
ncbi:MAG: tetratricopeptide repeat protein [Pseudomonadota bacterium]